MELKTIHERTAKWIDDTWNVTDVPSHYWEDKTTRSPTFSSFNDALQWIIKHDERLNENRK